MFQWTLRSSQKVKARSTYDARTWHILGERPLFSRTYLLAVLVLAYFFALPIACRLNNRRVPILLRPLAHVLETPVYAAMEWYLGAWGVDPNLVRCAMYEP